MAPRTERRAPPPVTGQLRGSGQFGRIWAVWVRGPEHPGFLWDLEDDRETKDTMTVGLEVGKLLTPQFAVTGKPSIQAYGTEDFAWAVELSITFSFD